MPNYSQHQSLVKHYLADVVTNKTLTMFEDRLEKFNYRIDAVPGFTTSAGTTHPLRYYLIEEITARLNIFWSVDLLKNPNQPIQFRSYL